MKIKASICGLLFTMMAFLIAKAEDVTITGAVWCPNNCYPDTNKPGIMLELTSQALKLTGRNLFYTELPWSRAVLQTQKGNFDALIGASKFDAPDFIYSEEPIAIAKNCFFTRADSNWEYSGQNSLEQILLGVGRDETLSDQMDDYIGRNETERVAVVAGSDYLNRLLAMLLSDRITAVIADENVFNYLVSLTSDRDEIRKAGCMSKSLPVYLAFSPAKYSSTSPILMDFDRAIRDMKKNGEFARILSRYGASAW